MTRKQLETLEESLIQRMLDLDERCGDEEYEDVHERLALVQCALLASSRDTMGSIEECQ